MKRRDIIISKPKYPNIKVREPRRRTMAAAKTHKAIDKHMADPMVIKYITE